MDEVARKFYYDDHFGFRAIPAEGEGKVDNVSREEDAMGYALALCNAVAADKEASPKEIAWIEGYSATKGYGKDLVDSIKTMVKDAETKSLEAITEETKKMLEIESLKDAARAIIYDSLRASASDGLPDDELQATKTMGKELGVEESEVLAIRDLVMEEIALKKKRIKLLYPKGSPFLQDEFNP